MDWADAARTFITLFVVIDPIGTLPVFLFATQSVPREYHARFALRAVFVATVVLFVFLTAGQLLLNTLGLRLGSFQIAGGIILFLFALTMIFGEGKAGREIHDAERDHLAGAVFPLAIPSIASPGAMLAVVILTDNANHTFGEQIVVAILLGVVLVITLGLLLLSSQIQRLIGDTGASVISRVMGLILATVAVDSILAGFETLGVLTLPRMPGTL